MVGGPPRLDHRRRRAIRTLAITAVVFVALALTLSQLLIPPIATDNLRSSLERNGRGVSVQLSAFPALELVFGQADAVKVRIRRLVSGRSHVGGLIASAADVGSLDARVGQLDTHGLELTNVSLTKHGAQLAASSTVTRAAVQAALPLNLVVLPSSVGAPGIVVRGGVDVLGQRVSGTAEAQAVGGQIVLRPAESGLASVLNSIHITVFSNPAIWVDRVNAVSTGSAYRVSAAAHYR